MFTKEEEFEFWCNIPLPIYNISSYRKSLKYNLVGMYKTISTSSDKKAKENYDHNSVHMDLENGKYAGSYGWDNAAYIAIAEKKAGVDLKNWHKKEVKMNILFHLLKN